MSLSSYSPILDLAVTLALISASTLLGARMLASLGLPSTKGLLDLALAGSLGLAALSFATMGLGLGWLISTLTVAGLLCAATLAGLTAIRQLGNHLSAGFTELRMLASVPWVGRWALLLMLLAALLNLGGSLSPVTYSDSLNHYMAFSRHVVQQGGLSFEPYKWWNMPALVEMLYVDALALFPGSVGAPIEWAYGVLTLAALAGLGLSVGGTRAALIGPLVFYAVPFVTQESTIAKNDLALALEGLLALACLVQLTLSGHARWVVLAGVFAGLALSAKLYGLLLATGIGCALLVLLARERRSLSTRMLRLVALFGVVALLVGAPWYLRAWLQGGDPIWPFGYPVFHSRDWDAASYAKFANYELGLGSDAGSLIMGPWNLTANLAAFDGERVPVVLPIFLALLPALPLVWRRLSPGARTASVAALVSAAVYYVAWFWLYQQPGYLLPAITLLVVPIAIVAGELVVQRGIVRFTAAAAVAGVVVFGAVVNVGYNLQFANVVLGREEPRAFVASKVLYFQDIEFANRSLPPGSKVLVFPTTDFYFDVPHVNGQPGFQGYVNYLALPTEEALLQRWRQLGITHVFKDGRYFEAGADFVRAWSGNDDRLRRAFDTLIQRGILEPIYHNPQAVIVESRTLDRRAFGNVTIYRVKYAGES